MDHGFPMVFYRSDLFWCCFPPRCLCEKTPREVIGARPIPFPSAVNVDLNVQCKQVSLAENGLPLAGRHNNHPKVVSSGMLVTGTGV